MDISSLTSTVFYAGTRKLLGKQTIFAVEAHSGLLLAGGSVVDGVAGKVQMMKKTKLFYSVSDCSGYDVIFLYYWTSRYSPFPARQSRDHCQLVSTYKN